MALPELIEIVPLTAPVRAEITVPGSKSITNRALVLAALADGETTLTGALWSEDTQVMVECLQELGFMVNVAPDPNETCNRTITVYGRGGKIPGGGTAENPLELFVGNAGTAARFLAAMVCLGSGVYRLHGVPRMRERPQAALFSALRELGYRVEATNDKLPAVISQKSELRSQKSERSCTVSIAESSQFASALLLCAKRGGWDVKIVGENADESPYVALTSKLIEAFPKGGGTFQIEPDASSWNYIWAAEILPKVDYGFDPFTSVLDWETSMYGSWQIDSHLPERWKQSVISRKGEIGDGIMLAIVLSVFRSSAVMFTNLAPLRVQECERVVALREELTKCGAKVAEMDDTLTVFPSTMFDLHGAEIETYNDHRMAMCFAILGLKVPGIKLKNPACVKKTFPNFFQKLATPPPHGLGATILDGTTGKRLGLDELFAD